MAEPVAVPLWLLIVIVAFAAWAALDRLLLPSVRWFFRRRVNRLIAEINARLDIEIPAFDLTKRHVLIDRLLFDPKVQEAAAQAAAAEDEPRELVMARVERYVREIVPAFNAYVYFRFGYALAKRLATLLYRVELGFTDDAGFKRIEPKSSVVFVMNHRSNMDYVLVGFLAAERARLSYAVGEWARIWPLQQLIRAMGAYFVRRNSGDPLYRRVLERYVQMATEAGVTQAVYPEGGLSRDGRLRPPKFGLIDYMVKDFDPGAERDLVFIPVGLNYDRVLEDRSLIRSLDPDAPDYGAGRAAATTMGFVWRNLRLAMRRRWHRFGYACVNFGTPVSMRAYLRDQGVDFRGMDEVARRAAVERLATDLMAAVGRVVPVLPVSLVAATLLRHPDQIFTRLELKAAALRMMRELQARGAHVHLPRDSDDHAVNMGIHMLELRRLAGAEPGLYSARDGDFEVLSYYANAIEHHLPEDARNPDALRQEGAPRRRGARRRGEAGAARAAEGQP